MIAGALHTLVGMFGIVGLLLRFIGPVTVVPALTLMALYIFSAAVRFAKAQWGIAALYAFLFLNLFLFFDLSFDHQLAMTVNYLSLLYINKHSKEIALNFQSFFFSLSGSSFDIPLNLQ